MGHVFVGLDLHRRTQGKNAPETTERMDYSNRALEAVLHAIDPTRPCALVTESWRHTLHKPERPGLEDLPVFPSVHSAIDAGYDLVAVMKPCSPRKGMLAFRNHCLLVSYHWGSLAGHTASQSLTSCDGKGYPLDAIAAVVALPLSLADDEGKIPMADVYLANGKTGAFLDNGKIGIHVHAHRSADVLEQVKDHLAKQGMQYQPQIQTYEGYPPHVRDLLPDPAEARA